MITVGELEKYTIAECAHYNGGPAWFGYGYRCVEQPRLYKLVRYFRKTKKTEVEWHVDGKIVADLTSAVAALNVAAVLTDEESDVLSRVPSEFTRCRDPEFPWQVLHALCDKGKVEFSEGKCRRRTP